MNKLLLLSVLLFFSCSTNEDSITNPKLNYTIEGKWVYPNNALNTMYIFKDGIRYTYYCVGEDCESQYESFQAADGNHLPTTHAYTYENNILIVDLHFGNELIAPLLFECDGNKITLKSTNPYDLIRFGFDCD